MPLRPSAPCHMPGCPARAVRRGYCEAHALQAETRYLVAHPDGRASAAARGYDQKWRRVRAAFLKAHPRCMWPGCDALATDVDHMLPKSQGGSDSWSNLQALCHPHHSIKTDTQDGGFGNRRWAPKGELGHDC